MQSLFKKVITNDMYLVMTEAIVVWMIPAIILSIVDRFLPIKMVQTIHEILFIFTLVDMVFCVGYLIMSSVLNKKQSKLNMEPKIEVSTINDKKGEDLWLKEQVLVNSNAQ